jgi:4-hydroxybenzoate polyprenyltransferase
MLYLNGEPLLQEELKVRRKVRLFASFLLSQCSSFLLFYKQLLFFFVISCFINYYLIVVSLLLFILMSVVVLFLVTIFSCKGKYVLVFLHE